MQIRKRQCESEIASVSKKVSKPTPATPKPSAERKPASDRPAQTDLKQSKVVCRPRRSRKDAIRRGDPASERYFQIRRACTNDDASALQTLLPTRVVEGKDFSVWPRQHLLLHGLAKAGCVNCVKYLVQTLRFDVNQARPKDNCTPLHMAHYNLVGEALNAMHNALLGLNADQLLKNKYGEVAPDLVAKSGAVAVSPGHSPCGVADLLLGAPELPPLALGLSASPRCTGKTQARSANEERGLSVEKKVSALPATAAQAPAFVPSFGCMSASLIQAYTVRDPRSCAWQPPADAGEAKVGSPFLHGADRKEGTPSGDLFQAVRKAAVMAMATQWVA
jgi:hypothetical protein